MMKMKVFLFVTVCVGLSAATNLRSYCSANFPQPCLLPNFTSWYKVGSYCVKYFGTPLNYSDAEFSCRKEALGAHLVSIHSEESNKAILCITMKYNHTSPRVWLGGFELFRTEKFVWTDGSNWNYAYWVPGQPDNTANAEDCVEMNWSNTGKWNDDKCSGNKAYICGFKDRAAV